MTTLLGEFKSITEALNAAGIEYAVCGGWAMAIHGLPRATKDIDLLVLANDLDRILQLLRELGFDVEGLPLHFDVEIRRVSKISTEPKQLITVDLLLVNDLMKDVWQDRQRQQWDEGMAIVVSREGLVKMSCSPGEYRTSRISKSCGRLRMKVDMSQAGVTARLREMDDLWLLSAKLMNAAGKNARPYRRTAARALEIRDSIRKLLINDWDPVGIANGTGPGDEYDAYIAQVYRILVGTRSESDLIECLRKIERDEIGVEPAGPDRLLPVVRKLLALSVELDTTSDVAKTTEPEK